LAEFVKARVPVGLGVDGAASNEDGGLASEMRAALQFARLAGGPQALTARQALARATIDGARCLGRDDELGSLEVGKLADVALWRLDGLNGAGIEDPVAALVFGATQSVEVLLVGGREIVRGGELRTVDEAQVAGEIARESRRLADRAGARV
jgi:cytosine/adenosine deaminase-related metal-dependent hydrolase